MNKKFMKVRRIAVPTLTLIIMASQFMGCAANTQETMKMMEGNQEAGAADLDSDKATSNNEQTGDIKGKEEELSWTELASLETVPEIRDVWNQLTEVRDVETGESKGQMFYVNSKGEFDDNNTLKEAIQADTISTLNQDIVELQKYYRDDVVIDYSEAKEALETFAGFASNYYADIDSKDVDTAFLAGLNAYFNLLPDSEQGKADMEHTLSRKEFMAMVYRADTPVQELTEDKDFTDAVGESEYNVYAQNLKNNSYLTTDSGDLNKDTYNSAISRAEAIYILVNRYYRDELLQVGNSSNGSVSGYTYVAVKDGNGDAVRDADGLIKRENTEIQFTDAKLNTGITENTLESLNEAIKDPDSGMPKYLYASLIVAVKHNIIDMGKDVRWDESITKEETLQLLVDTYECMSRVVDKDDVSTVNTEEFVTNEQQEEAELQAAYDEYKKAMAMTPEEREKAYRTTTVHDNGTIEVYNEMAVIINKILADRKKKGLSTGNYHFKPGYDLMQDENGLHYLKSVIDGHEVHIGERCDDGWQYIGEIEDCDADYVYWIRFCNPGLDKTDEEIIAGRH